MFKKLSIATMLYVAFQSVALAAPVTVYNLTSNPVRFAHTLCSSTNGICQLTSTNQLEARTSQRNEMRIVLPIDNAVDQFVVSSANMLDQNGRTVGQLASPCRMSKDVNFVLFTVDTQNNLTCQHGHNV